MDNQNKYYLITYYARLPNGGFGFSRTYYHIPPLKVFNMKEFEEQMAIETQLKPNDISLINRINISVEEYNNNTDNNPLPETNETSEHKLSLPNGPMGDETNAI